MKILIDTNVLVSAFVFKGKPRELIYRLLFDRHRLIVTSYVEREFRKTLARKWPNKADVVYANFSTMRFVRLESSNEQYGSLRDKKDIPVLSDAVYYNVDVILSGDKDFFEAGLERPAVKSASELWDFLGYGDL